MSSQSISLCHGETGIGLDDGIGEAIETIRLQLLSGESFSTIALVRWAITSYRTGTKAERKKLRKQLANDFRPLIGEQTDEVILNILTGKTRLEIYHNQVMLYLPA